MTLTYNLSIWEASTGGSRVQCLPQPDNESWPSLDDPVSKQIETCGGGGGELLSIFETWQLFFPLGAGSYALYIFALKSPRLHPRQCCIQKFSVNSFLDLSHTVKSDKSCDELTSIVCYCGVKVTSQAASDTWGSKQASHFLLNTNRNYWKLHSTVFFMFKKIFSESTEYS